jgi:3-oxoacyl-[acyl-carrier protein] reductase
MMLKDKVALVTGAAGNGMGRSIALTIAREGASVVVNYRNRVNEAAAIVEYIESRDGKAIAFQADITRLNQCREMYDAAIREFGRVDICIVNPGAGWHEEAIDKLDVEGALDDINREVAPLYNLMSLALPGMYERKWGRFIGISLALGLPSPSYAYDAAKAARTGALKRAAGDAWRHGVTVNVITPGPVAEIPDFEEAIELCQHGRAWTERSNINPQDIAEGIAWLCSDAGRYVTGCEIPYNFHRV